MKRLLFSLVGIFLLAILIWNCSGNSESPKDKPSDIVVNPNYVKPETPPPARPTIHDFRSYELNFNHLKLPWETDGHPLPLSLRNRLPNSYIGDLEQYDEMYTIGKFKVGESMALVLYGETKNQESADYLIHTFSGAGTPVDTLYLAGKLGTTLQTAEISESGCITRTKIQEGKALPLKIFGHFESNGSFVEQKEICAPDS